MSDSLPTVSVEDSVSGPTLPTTRFSNVRMVCWLLCSSVIFVQFGYYLGRTSSQHPHLYHNNFISNQTEVPIDISSGMDTKVDGTKSESHETVFKGHDVNLSDNKDVKTTIEYSPSSGLKMDPTVSLVQNPSTYVTRGSNYDTNVPRDRSILISIHNKAIAMGLSLIRELRCHGNNELIQVYHCFANELSIENQQLLVRFDRRIEIIDVCEALIKDGRLTHLLALKFQSYWIKPLAVIHTDVRHVLLLDADDILLSDPSLLRDQSSRYQTNGTLFFYDRVINCNGFFNANNYLRNVINRFDYQSFGITGPKEPSLQLQSSIAWAHKTCHEMDSSMVFIDKEKVGQAMKVLWWLITIERFNFSFSWGDKESFWLAYELAHQPYSFSPWGVSVVSHTAYGDMIQHPDTLCGSIAQYIPMDEDEEREKRSSTASSLLYVNGRALIEPFPQGFKNKNARINVMFNENPTHVTPKQIRSSGKKSTNYQKYPHECLVGLGSTPLPDQFKRILFQRRIFYMGITTNFTEVLEHCTLH